jgi:hypothetical protein
MSSYTTAVAKQWLDQKRLFFLKDNLMTSFPLAFAL